MMDILRLPPPDLLPYLAPPISKQVSFAAATAGQAFIPADPSRLILIISTITNTAVGQLGFDTRTTGNTNAISLPSVGQPFFLSYWLYGPIVGYAWTFSPSGAGMTLGFTSQSYNTWPQSEVSPLDDLKVTAAPPEPIAVPSAPSVNGRQSVVDYWRSLMSRIKGG